MEKKQKAIDDEAAAKRATLEAAAHKDNNQVASQAEAKKQAQEAAIKDWNTQAEQANKANQASVDAQARAESMEVLKQAKEVLAEAKNSKVTPPPADKTVKGKIDLPKKETPKPAAPATVATPTPAQTVAPIIPTIPTPTAPVVATPVKTDAEKTSVTVDMKDGKVTSTKH